MKLLSVLLDLIRGIHRSLLDPPYTVPVMQIFGVSRNKLLIKQSSCRWDPMTITWRHTNGMQTFMEESRWMKHIISILRESVIRKCRHTSSHKSLRWVKWKNIYIQNDGYQSFKAVLLRFSIYQSFSRLIMRSDEVSEQRDMTLGLFDGIWIGRPIRCQCCRGACQKSEQHDNSNAYYRDHAFIAMRVKLWFRHNNIPNVCMVS